MPYVGQTITDVFPTSINVDTATIATANISNQLTDANMSAGSAVQVVNVQTGALVTGSTTIPVDDTIPQKTEGIEMFTLAITPTNASNKLHIQIVWNGNRANALYNIAVALFQDDTAGALAAAVDRAQNQTRSEQNITLNHFMTAGTTSETTFKVRAGASTSGGVVRMNVQGTSRSMGGVMASGMTITEIAV